MLIRRIRCPIAVSRCVGGKRWQQEMFSKDKVAERRGAIMDRGRKQ